MSPSPTRVAYAFLVQQQRRLAGEDLAVAPSAESLFWHNPERYEVRQHAESGAHTNHPDVVEGMANVRDLTRTEVEEHLEQVMGSPLTPAGILEAHPAADHLSTLNRYLVETVHPVPELPGGKADRPQTPDPSEEPESMALGLRREAWLRKVWFGGESTPR